VSSQTFPFVKVSSCLEIRSKVVATNSA